jgi:hypothetical protein
MQKTITYRVTVDVKSDWDEPYLLIDAASQEEAAELAKEAVFRTGLEIAVECEPVEEVAAAYLNEELGVCLKYTHWHIGRSRFNPGGGNLN